MLLPVRDQRSHALGIWATGLVGTALVGLFEPLAADDPLRSTLLILPLVAAALVSLHRWAGGSAPGRRASAIEAAALAALVLLTVARGHLGLSYPQRWLDTMMAAGFLLLLAHRTARIALASRRLLENPHRRRPSLFFLLLPWVVYLAILPWSAERRAPNGDEPYNLLLSHSIAYDLDADLANNYRDGDSLAFMDRRLGPQPGDPRGPDGAIYSRHNLALPLLLAPFYRLAGKPGVLALMALISAVAAWMVLKVALRYFPHRPGEALLVWALTGFAPPLLFYSSQVWVEVPAALLVLVALDGIGKLERPADSGGRWWLLLAASLALLALLKLRFLLLVGPLVLLAAWRSRRGIGFLLWGAGVLAALGGGILAYNAAVFGRPLKTHSWASLSRLFSEPPTSMAGGAFGLVFDGAFGLAAWAPLWLLLAPAVLLLIRRRHRLALDLLVTFTLYFCLLIPRREWFGGWSPPFRYGMVALPCLAIALVPLLADRRRLGARFLLTTLASMTLVLGITGVALPNWTYSFADGRSHLLDHLSVALGGDFSRFFPSYVRFRTASWVWPAVTLPALPLLWWLGSRRLRGAGAAALACLLLAGAATAALVHRMPSAVIEAEDPYLERQGGSLYPPRWIPARVRFRGGWAMAHGDRIVAPVTAGGSAVELEVVVESEQVLEPGLRLTASAGGADLASWQIERPGPLHHLRSGPLPWPPHESLTLIVESRGQPASDSRLLVDRVRFKWVDGSDGGSPPVPIGQGRQ